MRLRVFCAFNYHAIVNSHCTFRSASNTAGSLALRVLISTLVYYYSPGDFTSWVACSYGYCISVLGVARRDHCVHRLGCNLLALPVHQYLQTNPASILDLMCAAGGKKERVLLSTNFIHQGVKKIVFAYVYSDMCECVCLWGGKQMSVLVSCKHS